MTKKGLKPAKIFSLEVVGNQKDELLAFLGEAILAKKRFWLATPNPEFVIASKSDLGFLAVLKGADFLIPDGIGLVWAREVLKEKGFLKRLWRGFLTGGEVLLGRFSNEMISGTDLMEDLCGLAAKKGWSVYLLGGQPGVAKAAFENLKRKYPGLKGWAASGPIVKGKMIEISDQRKWVKEINRKGPQILLVGMGMEKQERFIFDNWRELKVNLAMGVGGAFDYFSGRVKRAPKLWRRMGLEWLWRLFCQPWRAKRQGALLKFIWLVLRS